MIKSHILIAVQIKTRRSAGTWKWIKNVNLFWNKIKLVVYFLFSSTLHLPLLSGNKRLMVNEIQAIKDIMRAFFDENKLIIGVTQQTPLLLILLAREIHNYYQLTTHYGFYIIWHIIILISSYVRYTAMWFVFASLYTFLKPWLPYILLFSSLTGRCWRKTQMKT